MHLKIFVTRLFWSVSLCIALQLPFDVLSISPSFFGFLQVLVVGGGDGGVVREVVKHPEVEEVHLCEIDQVRFLPVYPRSYVSICISMKGGYDHCMLVGQP